MIALITGGSSGLGFEVARALLRKNWQVIINGRDGKRLELAQRELGGRAETLKADVADESFARALLKYLAEKKISALDLVVHSAGTNHMGTIEKTKLQNARQAFAANALSVINITQATKPFLELGKNPQFIYVSTLMKYFAMPNRAIYAASKAAGEQIAEAWGIELRGAGSPIRVKIFRPAGIDTGFHGNTPTDGEAPRSNVSRMSAEKAAAHLHKLVDSTAYESAPGFANKLMAFGARHFPGIARRLLLKRARAS